MIPRVVKKYTDGGMAEYWRVVVGWKQIAAPQYHSAIDGDDDICDNSE